MATCASVSDVNPTACRSRRHFPQTTCQSFTGAVISTSSVPVRCSSARSFIDSTGAAKSITVLYKPKSCIISACWARAVQDEAEQEAAEDHEDQSRRPRRPAT
ncbi:MAG: hypothetical protein IPG72_00015 [Ardenticatenales bacterium]|nr:hypothetical protein [Ardenticatenales bacterium]